MTSPSKQFLEHLDRELDNRRLSALHDLDGFKSDIVEYFDNNSNGIPFRPLSITYTHEDNRKIIAEFEVIDSRPWTEIQKEIIEIWNSEIAYAHSQFEFTEDSSGQTFHFFTFEEDVRLFVTGQIVFRRS